MLGSIAVKNIVRNPRRSLLVGSLLFMEVMLIMTGDCLFETSRNGMRRSFVGSFTGDLFVSQRNEEALGLLGSSTPSIGVFASIPVLDDHGRILRVLEARPEVVSAVSQLSGGVNLEFMGIRTQVMMFGVDGDAYFGSFPHVRILEGMPLSTGRPGLMLSRDRMEAIAAMTGRRPVLGEQILLSVFTDMGFQLREAPLTGVFEYPASNDVLKRIAYVDADTLRSLFGLNAASSGGFLPDASATGLLSVDIDRMFDSGDPIPEVPDGGRRLEDVENELARDVPSVAAAPSAAVNWNFVVIRLKEGADAGRVRAGLQRSFREQGIDAVVGDWSTAAGSGASLASGLRAAYNVGLVLLAFVVLMVTANTLVIGVLQRKPEMATMRALGASKGAIRRLLLAETMLLAGTAVVAGLAVSTGLLALLRHRGIPLGNPLLAMLFGGGILRPQWSARSFLAAALATVLLACVAWVFPSQAAMKVPPVAAMKAD